MALQPQVIWTPFGPIYPESIADLFRTGPQTPDEPQLHAGVRQSVQGVARALTGNPLTSPLNPTGTSFRMAGNALSAAGVSPETARQALRYATDTPRQEQARARQEQQQQRRGRQQPRRAAAPVAPTPADALANGPNDPASQVFRRMIGVESGGQHWARPGVPLTSPAGAVGIAQVMPGTAPEAARLAGVPYDEQRYRNDPAYNLRLGQAYYYKQLRTFGNPAMAAAAYNAGPARLRRAMRRAARAGNPSSWLSYMPAETQSYVSNVISPGDRVASALGTPPPGMGPYMEGWSQGMASLEEQRRAMLTPFSSTFNPGPRPEMPAPAELQAPDFSASNAAFEEARPNKPFEGEGDRNRFLRQNFLRGIGEAMLSLTPGRPVGFGELLMRAGAGALSGRMAGEDRARAMDREFDQAMQRYNAALAERNEQQVVAQTNIINQNVQQRNQYAQRQFEVRYGEWARDSQPEIIGTNLRTFSTNPDGTRTVNLTPIPSFVNAAIAGQQAQAYFTLGSANDSNARWNWQASQGQAMNYAAIALSQGGQTGAEAAVYGIAQNTAALVESGTIRQIVPARIYDTYVQQAYRDLGINAEQSPLALATDPNRGALPEQLQNRVNEYIINRIVTDALAAPDGDLARTILTRGAAAGAVARIRETRTSRRTDSRGRVSTTESVGN